MLLQPRQAAALISRTASSLTTCLIPNSGGFTGSQRNVVMCA
jgi:hypothetical protein